MSPRDRIHLRRGRDGSTVTVSGAVACICAAVTIIAVVALTLWR
jgi:hypothetical protein